MAKIEAGQVVIKKLTLINANRSSAIDLRSILTEISFFEDISRPSLFCEVTVADGNNIRKTLPIIGEEFLEVEFTTPLFDDYSDVYGTTTFKNIFKMYSVTDLNSNQQSKQHTYQILGVSEEHIKASNITIEKSYTEGVANAVRDILFTHLDTRKNIIVETTKGTFPLLVPSLSPFKAIDWLRRRAVSQNYSSSSFVFFENSNGFNFRTIEGLIDSGVRSITKMKYVHNPTIPIDLDRPRKDELFNIIDFTENKAFDTIDKIQLGMVDSSVSTYDFFTKRFTSKSFDWERNSYNFKKLNSKNDSASVNLLRDMDSISDKHGNTKRAMGYFIPQDSSRGEHFIDTTLANRQAFTVSLNQNSLTIYIYGNTILKVGDVIALDIKVPTKKVQNSTATEKIESSAIEGNFLITKIRHIITMGQRFEHRIAAEVINIGNKL